MRTTAILLTLALLACEHTKEPTPADSRDTSPSEPAVSAGNDAGSAQVKWYGSIKTVFGGDWSKVAALNEVAGANAAYALGALSDLRGEFVVLRGRAMLAYPSEGALPRVVAEHGGSSEAATLLVTAEVPSWREFTFAEEVSSDALEAAIRSKAEANGVDVSEPFPFLLRGLLRNIDWHVADGTKVEPGMRPDTNAQHGLLKEAQATIVGFYSTQHQGVFTMAGQNTHMHVISEDHSVLGHVRTLDVAEGAVLSLP